MKILKALDLNDVVFLDIETVACVPKLEAGTLLYDSWVYKMKYQKELVDTGKTTYEQLFDETAALHAEFARIVCVTIGKIKDGEIKLKSYAYEDEAQILKEFCSDLINIIASNKNTKLCGHTIIGFDIPFLMRRCIVKQVEMPSLIDTGHLKPWELTAIDTAVLWKGSGMTGASLLNIAVVLGLQNPKDEMYPYETTAVFHTEGEAGLKRIQKYCEDDVVTVANIVRKCRYEDIVERAGDNTIETKKVGVLERVYNTKMFDKASEKTILDNFKALDENEVLEAKTILEVIIPKTKSVTVKTKVGR